MHAISTHAHTHTRTHSGAGPHVDFVSVGGKGGEKQHYKASFPSPLFMSWFSFITDSLPFLFFFFFFLCVFRSCMCALTVTENRLLLLRQKPWQGTKQNSRTYFYPDWLEKCQRHCKAPWGMMMMMMMILEIGGGGGGGRGRRRGEEGEMRE